ncbi:hypothetical protein MUB24_10290 [Lederbergia sp. NSJ-179]|uniref:hypothetical protein n=1 Tax=Lederbergia sp. NSJ-179 TaxID=2931402 RepID=UPI001FD3BA7F|nr:hypothetical protein [Lederbergia sp. NSJ-179]MCJ7841282.1 hypothetical protein [Lederbergia sp. NSJ-179]
MKVNELREVMKNRKKDELQQLVVEMYKAIPKKMREEKEIDQLISDPQAFKKKKTKQKQQLPNFDVIERETEAFIENARAQNYVAPNRVISKKERSNWRFTAKRLVEQITAISHQPEHRKACASLLEELYKLFCYASGHYVFASDEPFYTIKIPREDFLKRVILLKKDVEDPEKWIFDSLNLVLEHGADRYTLTSSLLEVLLSTLSNAPLKEKMVQIADRMLQKKQMDLKKLTKSNKRTSTIGFYNEEYINNLVEMIFITQSALGEYKAAVDMFQKNYLNYNNDKEVNLYILLSLIEKHQRVKDWIEVYEKAIQNKIKPRKNLQEMYDYIKVENEFPKRVYIF